jgi:hypothetical protein
MTSVADYTQLGCLSQWVADFAGSGCFHRRLFIKTLNGNY